MFADDIQLVREMTTKYNARGPFVDVGGLERPCVADYQRTIDAMAKLRWDQTHEPDGRLTYPECVEELSAFDIEQAQRARYLDVEHPLSFLGDYVCENPETGGLAISDLWTKYNDVDQPKIGTAILLSVLEHVDDPFEAAEDLRDAMAPSGLAIVSVPFMFPEHPSPRDLWRFTPDGLRAVFEKRGQWELLWCDWRLRIAADAGVLCSRTGKPQAIESCACVARVI